ncbi:MAG: DUF3795 domain-containing protein [Bacillota bacterium]
MENKTNMIIAKCGLVCSDCPTYIATQNDDDEMRKNIAEQWTQAFKYEFKAEDINCDGCQTKNGRLCSYCKNICQIRPCALEKNVENCAHCESYSCEKLDRFYSMAAEAKEMLEEIKVKLGK